MQQLCCGGKIAAGTIGEHSLHESHNTLLLHAMSRARHAPALCSARDGGDETRAAKEPAEM